MTFLTGVPNYHPHDLCPVPAWKMENYEAIEQLGETEAAELSVKRHCLLTAGSTRARLILMNVSPPQTWGLQTIGKILWLLSLYLDSQMVLKSLRAGYYISSSIWLQWVSHWCDHSSVGKNMLRACHWPLWLDIHDVSFSLVTVIHIAFQKSEHHVVITASKKKQ